jgi:hypothetical protein
MYFKATKHSYQIVHTFIYTVLTLEQSSPILRHLYDTYSNETRSDIVLGETVVVVKISPHGRWGRRPNRWTSLRKELIGLLLEPLNRGLTSSSDQKL